MKRQHFSLNRIASSDRYKLSRKVHIEYIKRCHTINKEEIEKISVYRCETIEIDPELLTEEMIEKLLCGEL